MTSLVNSALTVVRGDNTRLTQSLKGPISGPAVVNSTDGPKRGPFSLCSKAEAATSSTVKLKKAGITLDASMMFCASGNYCNNSKNIIFALFGQIVENCRNEPNVLQIFKEGPDRIERVQKVLQSLMYPFIARLGLIKDKKAEGRVYSSFKQTYMTLIKVESIDQHRKDLIQTFVKYWNDRILCECWRDPTLPDIPSFRIDGKFPTLYHGWAKHYVARRVLKSDTSFCASLQKGTKQAWPPLQEYGLLNNIKKNFDRLTAPQRGLASEMYTAIAVTAHELFTSEAVNPGTTNCSSREYTNSEYTKLLPTMSACYQRPCLKFGNWGLFKGAQPVRHEFETVRLRTHVPGSFDPESGIERKDEWKEKKVLIKVPITMSLEKNISSYQEGVLVTCDTYIDLRRPIFNVAAIQIVPLYEPSKIRIISKGDGYMYTAVQPVQGYLLNRWKNHRASSMKEQDLTESVNRIYRDMSEMIGEENVSFSSVDFEAATDLMKSKCTEAALSMLDNIDGIHLARKSFEPVEIRYGPEVGIAYNAIVANGLPYGELHNFVERNCPVFDEEGRRVDFGENLGNDIDRLQLGVPKNTEGQLMGHPLSFPLLCAVNLAVYYKTVEDWLVSAYPSFYKRSYREKHECLMDCVKSYFRSERGSARSVRRKINNLHKAIKVLRARLRRNVKVNGDDKFYIPVDETFERMHSLNCEEVSLKSSKGKDYRSKVGCLMNSQFFQLREGSLVRVGYLNQRFIYGTNVKSTGTGTCLPTQLSKDINEMVERAPWTGNIIPACMERFPNKNRANWYLPVHLGGFGLNPKFGPRQLLISAEQRRMATQFVNNSKLRLYHSSGTLPSNPVLERLVPETRLVVGDYVPNWNETFDKPSDWSSRVKFYEQCAFADEKRLKQESEAKKVSDGKKNPLDQVGFIRDYRLKGMKLDTLMTYWRYSRELYSIPGLCPSGRSFRYDILGKFLDAAQRCPPLIKLARMLEKLPSSLAGNILTYLF